MAKYSEEFKAELLQRMMGPKNESVTELKNKDLKKLEKELRRKDAALAETAALLVLRKKMNAIWGDNEED